MSMRAHWLVSSLLLVVAWPGVGCFMAAEDSEGAAGSGASVQDVNKLLKQHQEMGRMVKQVSKLGQKGLLRHGLSALRPGGGFGPKH